MVPDERLEAVTQKAVNAFRETIVAEFPQAKTSVLSPLMNFRLFQAAESAVDELVFKNCP